MKLIGLAGPSGSGKSTIASLLCRGYGFTEIGLADPLKRFLREIFDFSHVSPRVAPQTLGTDWGRALYDDIWIDYAMRVINQLVPQRGSDEDTWITRQYTKEDGVGPPTYWHGYRHVEPTRIVISDVRFENEAQRIRKAQGRIWHIDRPVPDHDRTHPSEYGITFQESDVRIDNAQDWAGMRDNVRRALDEWR